MYSLTRAAALVAAMLVAHAVNVDACPSQANQNKEPTGSISGRVTLADKPASGVTVMLAPGEPSVPIDGPVARTTTDHDGRFHLTRVPAGTYLLQTFTPAFVGPTDVRRRPGKVVNISDGETVEGIDIALTRGGVITGRIVDAEGRPLVQENVRLIAVDERGHRTPLYMPYSYFYSTDDRGVYRLFGIPPGRYIISAGTDPTQPSARMGFGNRYYPLTYHPDVTEQWRASTIEVTSGGEATGIDITVGRPAKEYAASGRIINDDTGRPIAGMNYGYGSLQPTGNDFTSSSTTSSISNSRGEFRLEGIMPGRYAAFAASTEGTDVYSDPVVFQITDAELAGLEIKVHRGSSLSGVVTIEDGSDQNGAPKLSDVRIGFSVSSQSLTPPLSNEINIGPDGSFRANGLRPGRADFFLTGTFPLPKGLSLLRVERDGVDQGAGVEIIGRELMSGIKVILGYGTGMIRGQANVEGGVLPEGLRLAVTINRPGGKPAQRMPVFPDARGRFSFEGLLPGDYDVSLYAMVTTPGVKWRPNFVKQTVSVNNGTEAQVTLVIDLNENK